MSNVKMLNSNNFFVSGEIPEWQRFKIIDKVCIFR